MISGEPNTDNVYEGNHGCARQQTVFRYNPPYHLKRTPRPTVRPSAANHNQAPWKDEKKNEINHTSLFPTCEISFIFQTVLVFLSHFFTVAVRVVHFVSNFFVFVGCAKSLRTFVFHEHTSCLRARSHSTEFSVPIADCTVNPIVFPTRFVPTITLQQTSQTPVSFTNGMCV